MELMVGIRIKWMRIVACVASLCMAAQTHAVQLPSSTPQAQGVQSQAIERMMDFLMALPSTTIHHVVVMRHGSVIANISPAPYSSGDGHALYSMSKAFTALAVGIAASEGKLSLDDRIEKYFTGELKGQANAAAGRITVRQLLTMASGVTPNWQLRGVCDDWARAWLAQRCVEPGKRYAYDSMCYYMLAVIVHRATGQSLLDYLNAKLLHPMGIYDAQWEQSPEGYNCGGWGLRLSAESQAAVGQLLLDGGVWRGKRLVPRQWVDQATSQRIATSETRNSHATPRLNEHGDCASGWTARIWAWVKRLAERVRRAFGVDDRIGYGYGVFCYEAYDAFGAEGARGQRIVVVPEKDLVVVINADMQCQYSIENAVWNILLPACFSSARGDAAPLRASYTLPLPQGGTKSVAEDKWLGLELTAASNDLGVHSLRLLRKDSSHIAAIVDYGGMADTLWAGHNVWTKCRAHHQPPYNLNSRSNFKGISPEFTAASAYAWSCDTKLLITTHYTTWGVPRRIELAFEGDSCRLKVDDNFRTASFGLRRLSSMKGL